MMSHMWVVQPARCNLFRDSDWNFSGMRLELKTGIENWILNSDLQSKKSHLQQLKQANVHDINVTLHVVPASEMVPERISALSVRIIAFNLFYPFCSMRAN